MLSVLEQNPDTDWRVLLGSVDPAVDQEQGADFVGIDKEDDELASFKL